MTDLTAEEVIAHLGKMLAEEREIRNRCLLRIRQLEKQVEELENKDG